MLDGGVGGNIGFVNLSLFVNLILGLSAIVLAILVATDNPRGRWVTEWVKKNGQQAFGEYWNVHEFVVAGLLFLGGSFFLMVAVSIYAKKYDFWVLRWL